MNSVGIPQSVYTANVGKPDEPLMLHTGTSDYFLLADGQGSIIALTDLQGNVVERVQYQAYGKPVFENAVNGGTTPYSSIGNIFSYTGREYDAGTGLFYYRARYYDPNTGRFVQQDPLGFGGGDVDLYVYVKNNSISLTDPTGLIPSSCFMKCFDDAGGNYALGAMGISAATLGTIPKVIGGGFFGAGYVSTPLSTIQLAINTMFGSGTVTGLRQIGRQLNPIGDAISVSAGSYASGVALGCSMQCGGI